MPDDLLTVVGTCTEISERSGWTTFHIDVGRQYPVKLATKRTELTAAGRAASGTCTWSYREKESDTINEHTGKPYVNRYLEAVEQGGHAQPAHVSAEPARHALPPGDKDRAIVRQTCLKVAGAIIGGAGAEGDDAALEAMRMAQRFENWVYRDIEETPF